MKRLTLAGLTLVTAFLAACSPEQSATGPTVVNSGQEQPQNQPPGQPSDAVASIEVFPAAASASAGSATQFTAVVKNAAGQTLTGRTVVWSTSSSSVLSIDNTGLAVAKSTGSASVIALSEGKTGTGVVSVASAPPPPNSSTWANEPAGMTPLSNNPFDALNALGWATTWNTDGNVVPGTDPQRGNILRWNFPIGFTGGKGPGMEYLDHAPAKEVFAGFWWKPSSPWQNHPASHVNKIAFWYTDTHQAIDIQMYGEPPYRLDVVTQFSAGTFRLAPNVTTSPVTLGVWHKIEWHAKYASSAGASDGLVEWWMDGVLQGRYTNVRSASDAGFSEYQISPTWGGLDGVKTENDYYLYDDMHLSKR